MFILNVSFANDLKIDQLEVSLSADCEPLVTIAGCVNVASGQFHSRENDFFGTTIDPLTIERFFDGSSMMESFMGTGFGCQHPFLASSIQKSSNHTYAMISERDGFLLPYRGKSQNNKHICGIDPRVLKKGYTNLSKSTSNSHANFTNWQATFDSLKEKWTLTKGDGSERVYKNTIELGKTARHQVSVPTHKNFLLTEEIKPNGNILRFNYLTIDGKPKISRISTVNRTGTSVLNQIDFEYTPTSAVLTSSCGKKVVYSQTKKNISIAAWEGDTLQKIFLTSINSSQNGLQVIKMDPNTTGFPSLVKIEGHYGNFLEIVYGAKKKVEALFEPDLNGQRVKTFHFDYLKNSTKVYDAQNNLRQYFFDKDQRLTRIDFYNKGLTERQESFTWSSASEQEGWLESKTIHCGDQIWQKLSYVYDSNGNVIKKTIYGNLTGEKLNSSFKSTSQCDSYTTCYEYSKDGLNLLISQSNPQGLKYLYKYLPGTNLRTHEFELSKDVIQKRTFITYDDNGEIKAVTEDDGSSFFETDLKDVTYRKIKTICAEKDRALVSFGQPKQVTESIQDPATGKTSILRKTKIYYNQNGYEIKRIFFNSRDEYCYELKKEYDERGNVVLEIDPLNQSIRYVYDLNNKKIEEEIVGSGKITYYFYDVRKRLWKKEHHYSNDDITTNIFVYNSLNQLIFEYDVYGNSTTYVYDALGRKIQTIKPIIANSSNGTIIPQISKKYNALNQVTEETDENNHTTTFSYNLYGDPTEIIHPDNSIERFSYYPCGWLKQHWKEDGTSLRYYYNPNGNVTREEWLDPDGLVLKFQEYRYKGNLLRSKTDASGLTTTYTYNLAGLKETESTGDKKIIHFEYDDFGRKIKVSQINENNQIYSEKFEYDWLDRIISQTIEDGNHTIFRHEEFEYDVLGNQIIKKTYHTRDNIAIYKSQYDAFGYRVFLENPLHHQKKWVYNYHYKNPLGQNVLHIEKIDSLGRKTIEEHDAYQRIVKREMYDKETLFSRTQYFYDGKGNLTLQKNAIINNGEILGEYGVQRNYNHRGLITSEIELPKEKEVSFVYNSKGNLIQKINPNKVIVHYDYDYLDRIRTISSSDGSVNYSFSYDLSNNPILVKDNVRNAIQKRVYDQYSRLIKEEIALGVSLEYSYDEFDLLTKVTLPDGSSFRYLYDICHLTKVERYNSKGKKIYEHHCTSYDLNGNLLKDVSPAGESNYQYDLLNRLTKIKTPFWDSLQEDFDAEGKVLSIRQTDLKGEETNLFSYDLLNHLSHETTIVSNDYRYDSLGNCIKKNKSKLKNNSLNQLIQDDESFYKYDLNGNLIIQSNPQVRFSYDALNRLTCCEINGESTHFTYDGFDRCIRIENEKIAKTLLYQKDREIGSMVSGNICELRLLHPQASNEKTFAVELAGRVYYPVQDHRFNICGLQDQHSLVQCYRYSAFGELQVLGINSLENPWLFANRRSVCGLSMFTHRFYNPKTRKWLTTDPIRFEDGINLYAYVRNNPLLYQDPNGEIVMVIPFVIGAIGTTGGITLALPSMSCIAGTICGAALGYVAYNAKSWYDNSCFSSSTELETSQSTETEEEKKKSSGKNPNWKPPRTEPNNLEEKLAMDEAKGIKDKEIKGIMEDQEEWGDPRYKKAEWKKCQHIHHPKDSQADNIRVHWWQHRVTGETHGYKFKDD